MNRFNLAEEFSGQNVDPGMTWLVMQGKEELYSHALLYTLHNSESQWNSTTNGSNAYHIMLYKIPTV